MKIILITLSMISFISFTQNIVPTNGDVGIGTTNPSAKLDVNGHTIVDSTLIVKDSVRFKDRLVVDKKVVFKENAVVKGNMRVETNARILNNVRVDHNIRVDGTSNLNGNVKMPNIAEINNTNNPELKILIKKPNGNVVTMTKGQLVNLVYADQVLCISDINGNPIPSSVAAPIWNNGLNKIYSYYPCADVNIGVNTPNPQFKLDIRGTTYTLKLKVGSLNATDNATANVFEPSNSRDIVNFGVKNAQTGQQSKVLFKVQNNGTVVMYNRTGSALISHSSIGNKILQLEDNGLLRINNQSGPAMIIKKSGGNEIFKIDDNGLVTISNNSGPAFIVKSSNGNKILQLEDNGILRAREIIIDANTWADYVFGKKA